MSFRDMCALASRKLRRRWLRSALSILAVSAALAPLTVIASLREGVHEAVLRVLLADSLPPGYALVTGSVRKDDAGTSPVLTQDDLDGLRHRPGVAGVNELPSFLSASLCIDEWNQQYSLVGCPSDFIRDRASTGVPEGEDAPIPVLIQKWMSLMKWDAEKGRLHWEEIDPETLVGRDVELIVGDVVGRLFPYEYRKRRARKRTDAEMEALRKERLAALSLRYDMEKLGPPKVLRVRIVGVSPTFATLLPDEVVRRESRWRVERERGAILPDVPFEIDPEEEDVYMVLVRIAPGADPLAVARGIRDSGLGCTSFELSREEITRHLDSVLRVVRGVIGAILVLGMLVVATTVSKVASDHEGVIGLYRAVGATRGQVASVFMTQAAMIGAAGGILGVAIGDAGARWINHRAIEQAGATGAAYMGYRWNARIAEAIPESFYRFDSLDTVLFLCAGVVCCVLAGLVPALRAAWKDPIAALRAE